MSANIMFPASQSMRGTSAEAHSEPRRGQPGDGSALQVELPFPTIVRGTGQDGQRFEEQTILYSLSTYQLCLRLRRQVGRGTKLFVMVRLSPFGTGATDASAVALCGLVLEAQAEPDGCHRIKFGFKRHRFLYALQAPVQ